MPRRSSIDIMHDAQKQFKIYDKRKSGAITSFACISALETVFSESLTKTDIEDIRLSLEDIVESGQFTQIVQKIVKNKQEKEEEHKIDEDFIVSHYSLKEITLFKKAWEKYDQSEGFLSFEYTRMCIENVLSSYKNSQKNDSEIKQFFINKANSGRTVISYAEYINFISKFIQYRKLALKRPSFFCFGN